MIRAAACAFVLALLAACTPPAPTTPPSDPLLFDAKATARADSVVIGIPGAFTSVRVFLPLQDLQTRNRATAYYRLPGYDERPAHETVDLDFAARRIRAFVAVHGFDTVHLVGHSTGSVIALEAAKELRRALPEVRVTMHGISTALPAPQPSLAALRGAAGTVAAAVRAGSLNPRKVWLEYYRRLAYGPGADRDPVVARAADDLVAANDDRITLPEDGLARRQTRALRRWDNPDPQALRGADITIYHGALDPVFPLRPTRRFVAGLPDAKLRVIGGHGHLLTLTYPQVWDEIVADIEATAR